MITNLAQYCSPVFQEFYCIGEGSFGVCLVKGKEKINIKQQKDYFQPDLKLTTDILLPSMH